MTAAMARFPDQRFTVICLSNNDEISPFVKTKQIAELYLDDQMQPVEVPKALTDEPKDFVTLPPAELENKTGAYRLLSEGRIWKVEVREGDLHVIDPLKNAWRLRPLSATRFRPVKPSPFYESARFTFHRKRPDAPFSMVLDSHEHSFHEVIPFERVELVEPSAEKLKDYEGTYFNDELFATYRFAVRDRALWLRMGSHRWEQLDPTVADEFIPHDRTLHDNRIFSFKGDDSGRVAGFSVAFWRVKGLDFKRGPADFKAESAGPPLRR
jgi:hypothetical protein